ncbi:hypothetical protein X733_32425 [Mesorhizobium sp. L2C067A000]|nr:hypothetical protein X733_32425 [Mesorhizobium sp. L2C067A000]
MKCYELALRRGMGLELQRALVRTSTAALDNPNDTECSLTRYQPETLALSCRCDLLEFLNSLDTKAMYP